MAVGWRFALLALLLAPCDLRAAEETVRVRIAIGGGAERRWSGTVGLNREGSLADPRLLGIEGDEPGSMWIEAGRLHIRQRSARAYDAVDLLVRAEPEAALQVQLTAADAPDEPMHIEVPLSRLFDGYFDENLDARGNRLLVRRTPGDSLRVDFGGRDAMIFAPGETFAFTVRPHLLPLRSGAEVRIEARLVAAHSDNELWSTHQDLRSGESVALPMELDLPEAEGVYDLILTATHDAGWRRAVNEPLRPQKWLKAVVVAQRKVQLLVLGSERRSPSIGYASKKLAIVREIDPANPGWREQLREQLARLPKLPKVPQWFYAPLGNGNMTIRRHALGDFVQLGPNEASPDVSWEAYTLPIEAVGQPHILEVEYPSDVPQTLGISVMEPNAAGALMPIGLDSGFDTPDGFIDEFVDGEQAPRLMRHRLIFWPRTTTPMVLMTNRRAKSPAVFGRIRVLAVGGQLPRASTNDSIELAESPGRLLTAYFDRPLFPENFSATEALDTWSRRSLDDWRTFYEGGSRMVEYLHHVGYNSLMISVLADGSTIYPSELLQPTPRYDTGAFFSTAQDPMRKDVLEMLFQLFDREGLQLIPSLEFAAPLPALESQLRAGGPQSEGMVWIGPDGRSWTQTHRARRGLAPYYNVLHPSVQEAMLQVVRELAGRYAQQHRSFSGLALRLSGNGYAQLPGPYWGMDDVTAARFAQDMNLRVPEAGANGFARRATYLAVEHRETWLQWRADQLHRFYQRIHGELNAIRPGSRLYLAGADMLSGVELEASLRPVLPRRATMADALKQVGIDLRHYRQPEETDRGALVLLCPEQVVPTGQLGAEAVNLEIRSMIDWAHYGDGSGFRDLPVPGSLFFHRPQEARIESFDEKAKGQFDPTYTWLVTQPAPSGARNRQRFVHSLAALDSQVLVDGGWMLPLGQEDALRDLVAAYRRLPAVRFLSPLGRGVGSSQPVTFRYATHLGKTYVYVVNDAPFATAARVGVNTTPGCRIEELSGRRSVNQLDRDAEGTFWKVELKPYDLVALRLSDPGASLFGARALLPGTIETTLKGRINDLGALHRSLLSPPPLRALDNLDFELPPVGGIQIPRWSTSNNPGVTITTDKNQPHGGAQSVHMRTAGNWACLVSQPFERPATGRLSIYAWLRVANSKVQPKLQVAVQGKRDGEDYYNYRVLPVTGPGAVPIGTTWTAYEFRFDDLPLQGAPQLQVRFDLSGPGEVWVDDVQLFDLAFDEDEKAELGYLVMLANVKLERGRIGDCMRLLDGYWPRFLEEHVPPPPTPPPPTVAAAPKPSQPPAEKPPQRTGFLDNLRSYLPKSLRF